MLLAGWLAFIGMIAAVGETPADVRRLVAKALDGNPRARRLLVRRLMPVVRATIGAHLRRVHRRKTAWGDIDDYAQDVWLALWSDGGKKLLAYEAERGISLESFVAVLAHRELNSRLRREMALKRGGDRAAVDPERLTRIADDAAGDRLEARDTGRALGAWLAERLSAKGQAIFRCLYSDGRSPAETAQVLGCTTQVVYNWQHKIRGLAREFRAQHA